MYTVPGVIIGTGLAFTSKKCNGLLRSDPEMYRIECNDTTVLLFIVH